MNETFYLKGTKTTVAAEGVFRWITTPAVDGQDLNGKFQSDIRATLQDASHAGIQAPIVVGVIPFDPAQNSALYVPKSYVTQDGAGPHPGKIAEAPEIVDLQLVPEHDEFTSMVSEAVSEIRAKRLEKVVLSRLNIVRTQKPLDSSNLLARVIKQNPHGFNFHSPLPEESAFLVGSSPELLIAKYGEHFHSKPLAGSAARDPTRDPRKEQEIVNGLLASAKDLYEHRVVVRSMQNTLKSRSKSLVVSDIPECISTPKIFHLATKIDGEVSDISESALSLGCLLHPTPALSGFPHRTAADLLSRLEPFNREYFGGIVGYSDSHGNGEWFIIIRSGKVQGEKVTLFGGAGIVGDSDPESEWRETETKISTMLAAISSQ